MIPVLGIPHYNRQFRQNYCHFASEKDSANLLAPLDGG
jgi:hypothetical protein